MSRESFHRLLQRYLDGECTSEEEQMVNQWYLMLDNHETDTLNDLNLEELENVLWEKINEEINDKNSDNTLKLGIGKRNKKNLLWWIAAAVVLFLITGGSFTYHRMRCYPIQPQFSAQTSQKNNIVVVNNTTHNYKRVILPDESVVDLYPSASLEYPKKFVGTNREVSLKGDAFFSVVANKHHPFWVFQGEMITKVVGTKFKIKAPSLCSKGEVMVYSGKVEVFYNVDRNTIMEQILSAPKKASITTNQRVVLVSQSITETLVENPLPVRKEIDAIKSEVFQDVPLSSLAMRLSKLYALDIQTEKAVEGITFTGNISGIELFKQLDIICLVTETQYEVIGKHILLEEKH